MHLMQNNVVLSWVKIYISFLKFRLIIFESKFLILHCLVFNKRKQPDPCCAVSISSWATFLISSSPILFWSLKSGIHRLLGTARCSPSLGLLGTTGSSAWVPDWNVSHGFQTGHFLLLRIYWYIFFPLISHLDYNIYLKWRLYFFIENINKCTWLQKHISKISYILNSHSSMAINSL